MTVLEPAGNVTFLIVLSCFETLVFRDTAGYSRNVSRIVCGIIKYRCSVRVGFYVHRSCSGYKILVENGDSLTRVKSRQEVRFSI